MCHISLKFQDENYFLNETLKLNSRMMRAAEQGPNQELIQDWRLLNWKASFFNLVHTSLTSELCDILTS